MDDPPLGTNIPFYGSGPDSSTSPQGSLDLDHNRPFLPGIPGFQVFRPPPRQSTRHSHSRSGALDLNDYASSGGAYPEGEYSGMGEIQSVRLPNNLEGDAQRGGEYPRDQGAISNEQSALSQTPRRAAPSNPDRQTCPLPQRHVQTPITAAGSSLPGPAPSLARSSSDQPHANVSAAGEAGGAQVGLNQGSTPLPQPAAPQNRPTLPPNPPPSSQGPSTRAPPPASGTTPAASAPPRGPGVSSDANFCIVDLSRKLGKLLSSDFPQSDDTIEERVQKLFQKSVLVDPDTETTSSPVVISDLSHAWYRGDFLEAFEANGCDGSRWETSFDIQDFNFGQAVTSTLERVRGMPHWMDNAIKAVIDGFGVQRLIADHQNTSRLYNNAAFDTGRINCYKDVEGIQVFILSGSMGTPLRQSTIALIQHICSIVNPHLIGAQVTMQPGYEVKHMTPYIDVLVFETILQIHVLPTVEEGAWKLEDKQMDIWQKGGTRLFDSGVNDDFGQHSHRGSGLLFGEACHLVGTTMMTGTSINHVMDDIACREFVALGKNVVCTRLPHAMNSRADRALRDLAQAANNKKLRYPSDTMPFCHLMEGRDLANIFMHLRSNTLVDEFVLRRKATAELGGLYYLALIFRTAKERGYEPDERLTKLLLAWLLVAIADVHTCMLMWLICHGKSQEEVDRAFSRGSQAWRLLHTFHRAVSATARAPLEVFSTSPHHAVEWKADCLFYLRLLGTSVSTVGSGVGLVSIIDTLVTHEAHGQAASATLPPVRIPGFAGYLGGQQQPNDPTVFTAVPPSGHVDVEWLKASVALEAHYKAAHKPHMPKGQ